MISGNSRVQLQEKNLDGVLEFFQLFFCVTGGIMFRPVVLKREPSGSLRNLYFLGEISGKKIWDKVLRFEG